MPWAAILPLVIQYGLPLAEQIWSWVSNNKTVTQDDWNTLKSLASATAKDKMIEALKRNNIDPDSEKGKSFLALVS